MKNLITKLTVSFLLFLPVHLKSQVQRPDIIYIMTDDMGYADLSGYGRKEYQTPNMDRLASQGIKFVNAYAAAPLCTPTRTAFITGRYPARTPVGLIEPLTSTKKDSAIGLTIDYPSIATLLKAGGYETALIGKWHLGIGPQHSPVKNGFDYYFGIHTGAADYISHTGDNVGNDLYENDKPVVVDGYLTDIFSQKAISFLRKKHTKPFFLEITFNAPHWPWQRPGDQPYPDTMDFRSGGSPATYAVMMKSLDDAIGNILKALEEEHLSNNTIVIFTNDNGGERYSDNGGLSIGGSAFGKSTLWEGGIRVPAFVRWPGKIKAGTTTQQVAVTMDWTATILSLAGAKANPAFPLDGIDLMPLCIGKQKIIERTLYWKRFMGNKQKAMRSGHWKYLQDEKGEHLFDLDTDPSEKNDLQAKETAIFSRLKQLYIDWEKTVLQASPTP